MKEREMIVRVADIVFGIRYRYDTLPLLCENYSTQENLPEFWLSASDEEIEWEQKNAEDAIGLDLAESAAILKKLAEKLLAYDAFLLHAAVIEYKGIGYAFSAKSGVGKTTHIRLWRDVFGEGVRIINGDKPIIRLLDGKAYAYGTPWCGKERYNVNDRCELNHLCFLERAGENVIRRISNREAISRLLPQIMMYRNGKDNLTVLSLVDRFFGCEFFYLLGCTPTREAAEVAYFGMNEKGI